MLLITTQEVPKQEKIWVNLQVGGVNFKASAYQKGPKTILIVDAKKEDVSVVCKKRSELRRVQ